MTKPRHLKFTLASPASWNVMIGDIQIGRILRLRGSYEWEPSKSEHPLPQPKAKLTHKAIKEYVIEGTKGSYMDILNLAYKEGYKG